MLENRATSNNGTKNDAVSGQVCANNSASARGDRLWPPRFSRVFWQLTALRMEIESVIADYIDDMQPCRLVDFDCGNMPYRPLFAPYVQEYIGCDLPGNDLAEKTIDSAGVLPLQDRSADVVLSTQVMEHIESPAHYLQEASRVLREDGLLVLSTHGVWRYHPDPCDYWRWTSDGLRKQLESAGFILLRMRGVMGPEATALQIWQDAVLPRVPWRMRTFFTRWMQWRIERADRKCSSEQRNRDACVYVAIARKV